MPGRAETVERLREAVISLERSRRRERELRSAHEGLLDVVRVLAMADHREETFESLLGVLRAVLPFEEAAILVRAAEGDAFTPAARTADWLSTVRLGPGPMLARVVEGETVVMFDAGLADEWRSQAPPVRARCRSVIHVPLRSGPQAVLLVCTHAEPARFEQRHVDAIKRIVPLAGQILQKLDLREVISAREAERHARLAILSAIVDHIQAGILVEDDQRRVFAVNQVLHQMFVGHDVAEVDDSIGGNAVALHARFAFLAEQPDAFVRRTCELAEARVPVSGDEIRLQDGRVVERDYVPVATPDAGFVAHFWQYRDVTARRAREEQLRRQAYEDALTGLPNRARFTEELGAVLRTLRRHPSRRASVLFIDLDGFKAVNDRMGHAAGDELLVAFVDRLRRCVRDTDVVARRGGDEFTVLLVDVGPGEELRVAQRILDTLARPFSPAGQVCTITASIGVATCSPAHVTADDVVRDADAAMYRAKAAGKSCYRTFVPALRDADGLGGPPDRGRSLRSIGLPPNAAERLVDRARKS